MDTLIYDLYEIGGPTGFYVGQALRIKGSGWERRVRDHRRRKGGSSAAYQLLLTNPDVDCVGSMCALRGYVNLMEARLWDLLVVRGWKPVHPRPQEGEYWAVGGRPRSSETRAKIGAKARGRRPSQETRAKMSVAHQGLPSYVRTPETLVRMSTSLKGKPAWNKGKPRSQETREKISTALRGFKHTPETCAKRSAVRLGRKHSPETRMKIAAALCGKPSGMLGKKHSLETRAKMSATRSAQEKQRACR